MSPVSFEILDRPTNASIVYKTGTRTLLGYVWQNAKGWWSHLGNGHKVEGPFESRLGAGESLLSAERRPSGQRRVLISSI